MYKQRFVIWGIQKKSRRSPKLEQRSAKKTGSKIAAHRTSHGPLGFMTVPPGFDSLECPSLMFVSSVRAWSASFFESLQYHDGIVIPKHHLNRLVPIERQDFKAKEINFTLKLVYDLLDRGHEEMAGRMVRKAFLLLEDMLTLDGPALMWNMLEMMYHMLALRHIQLFCMLLTHLVLLVDRLTPVSHLLRVMLRSLQGLVACMASVKSMSGAFSPDSSSYSSSSAPSPLCCSDESLFVGYLPLLLGQAWTLKAEVRFTRVDPRLFHLYFGFVWESCSIAPPKSIVSATQGWFEKIEAQQALPARKAARHCKKLRSRTEAKLTLYSPLPPRNYEMLRANCIEVLGRQWETIIGNGAEFNGDTAVLLQMLAGLGTTRLLDGPPTLTRPLEAGKSTSDNDPLLDPGIVACMIRAVMDLNAGHSSGGVGAWSKAVEQSSAILALCEHSKGEIYPQVLRDMWTLQHALAVVGNYNKAAEVEWNNFHRIERYLQDVPLAST